MEFKADVSVPPKFSSVEELQERFAGQGQNSLSSQGRKAVSAAVGEAQKLLDDTTRESLNAVIIKDDETEKYRVVFNLLRLYEANKALQDVEHEYDKKLHEKLGDKPEVIIYNGVKLDFDQVRLLRLMGHDNVNEKQILLPLTVIYRDSAVNTFRALYHNIHRSEIKAIEDPVMSSDGRQLKESIGREMENFVGGKENIQKVLDLPANIQDLGDQSAVRKAAGVLAQVMQNENIMNYLCSMQSKLTREDYERWRAELKSITESATLNDRKNAFFIIPYYQIINLYHRVFGKGGLVEKIAEYDPTKAEVSLDFKITSEGNRIIVYDDELFRLRNNVLMCEFEYNWAMSDLKSKKPVT